MNKKVKGIVIKSKDVGEADKLITLLTAEEGKISVKLKSVKKAKAKLKFAAETFCFGEYELEKGKAGYICTGCDLYELFYELRGDIKRFYLATALLEIANNGCGENTPQPNELIFLINSLKRISTVKANIEYLAIKILLESVGVFGFGITDYTCKDCKEDISGKAYFVFDSCAFYCEEHKRENVSELSRHAYKLIKACVELPDEKIEQLPYVKEDALEALRFIYKLIYYKLYFKCQSISAFGKMI